MKYAFISDIHMQWANRRSADFRLKDDEFLAILKDIRSKCDKLFIVGDMFELLETTWLTKYSMVEDYMRTKSYYEKSLDFIIEDDNIVLIRGNHDYYINELGFKKKFVNFVEEDNMFIEHGVYDIFNTKFRNISRVITWANGMLERIFGRSFDETLDKLITKVGIRAIANKSQQKEAVHNAKMYNAKYIINGHTHKKIVLPFFTKDNDSAIYINTGKFYGDKKDITFLDTDTGEIIQNDIVAKSGAIGLAKELKRGDIILSKRNGILSEAIGWVTDSGYSHTMIYLGGGRIIEATGEGVVEKNLNKYLELSASLVALRLVDNSKAEKIIKHVKKRIGKSYNLWQLFYMLPFFIIKKLFKLDIRHKIEADTNGNTDVCSELVAAGIKAVYEKDVREGVIPSMTAPQDFLDNKQMFVKLKYEVK